MTINKYYWNIVGEDQRQIGQIHQDMVKTCQDHTGVKLLKAETLSIGSRPDYFEGEYYTRGLIFSAVDTVELLCSQVNPVVVFEHYPNHKLNTQLLSEVLSPPTAHVPPSKTEIQLAQLLHSQSDELQDGPTQTTYVTPHQMLTIGIGNDHVATIVIDDDALEELQKRLPGQFPSLHK